MPALCSLSGPKANIKEAKDLDGKKFASPQLGGTQDVALRNYIVQNEPDG